MIVQNHTRPTVKDKSKPLWQLQVKKTINITEHLESSPLTAARWQTVTESHSRSRIRESSSHSPGFRSRSQSSKSSCVVSTSLRKIIKQTKTIKWITYCKIWKCYFFSPEKCAVKRSVLVFSRAFLSSVRQSRCDCRNAILHFLCVFAQCDVIEKLWGARALRWIDTHYSAD